MDITGIAKSHQAGIPKPSSKKEWKLSDSLREQIAGYAREDAAQGVYMGNKFLALRKSEVAKVAPDRAGADGEGQSGNGRPERKRRSNQTRQGRHPRRSGRLENIIVIREVFGMLKKLNQITNITIGSFVGVFIGCGIYVFCDYKKHPDLYAMQSAPWYTSIFAYGIVMLIFVTVAVIAKLIIRKKMKEGINSTDAYHQ